jgi:hypothetical protein
MEYRKEWRGKHRRGESETREIFFSHALRLVTPYGPGGDILLRRLGTEGFKNFRLQ